MPRNISMKSEAEIEAEVLKTQGKLTSEQNAHKKILPLCYNHHRSQVNDDHLVSRHPWKKEFAKRYGNEYYLLERVKEHIVSN